MAKLITDSGRKAIKKIVQISQCARALSLMPTAEDFQRLRNADNLLVTIPWGRNNGRQVERVLAHLSMQKCEVKGLVITDAKDAFVKAYYATEPIHSKKNSK